MIVRYIQLIKPGFEKNRTDICLAIVIMDC